MTLHAKPPADLQPLLEPNALLLEALLGETRAAGTAEQERGFLIAIGQRIADTFTLAGLVELRALEAGMNQVWRMLNLGNVQLAMDKDGVAIEHRRSAERSALPHPQWDRAEFVIIEGVYGHWCRAFGNDRLALRHVGGDHQGIRFHYGL